MNERPVIEKQACFVTGFFVSLVFSIYGPRFGFLLAVGLGILKEIDDKTNYGSFDWRETVAVSAGGLAGYIIACILSIIF